jgi:transposase
MLYPCTHSTGVWVCHDVGLTKSVRPCRESTPVPRSLNKVFSKYQQYQQSYSGAKYNFKLYYTLQRYTADTTNKYFIYSNVL